MSKRAAQVQGGKELAGGFGNEMSANSADTPKRATAAQLASRKIKQARQRTRIASPNSASSTSQSFTSPFSAIDPNIVPPTSSTPTNGFSFGQAQSFPQTGPGTSTTTTPQSSFFGDQNNSGPKVFGSQAGSAPSSFSFTPSTTQEIKNPFASMSSGFGQSQGSTGGFQGFQGNTFNIPGTATNQDAQNKAGQQAPTGGMFGSSQPPQQTPFTFGATSAPKSASLFSAAPPVSTPTSTSAPIFGQSTGGTIFGASTPSTPSTPSTNIFGASSQANKPSDEMQMSPPAKSNGTGENRANQFSISQPSFTSSTTQPSIFETSAFKPAAPATSSTSQPFSSIFITTPSSGTTLFGAMKKPDETPKPTSSSTAPATFSFTPSTAPGSSIFGQASKPEDQAATAITTTSSGASFSTSFPVPAPAPAPFSLFGTTAKPKEPSSAPSATEDKVSSTKSAVPEPPTTPGASLFGQIAKPPEEPQASSTPTPEAEKLPTESPSIAPAATPSASPFPSTPSGGTSLFGRASKPAETIQPTSIFNTPATSTTPSAPTFSFTPSSTSIFQTPKSALATSDGEKTKEAAQSATGLFQTKAATDTTPSGTSKPFTSLSQAQQPPSSLFGSTPSPSLFKTSAGPEKAPSTPQASSTSPPEKFTPKPLFSEISNGVAGTTKAMDTSPTKAPAPLKRKEPLVPKSRLASYGPPAIPRELNNDERAEFDTEWRLNALNASFQKRVAEADPKSDDIDVLVEFYVRLRENIGVPMGLAVVPKTGKKRKAVEEDGHVAEDFSHNKRTKGLPTFTSQHKTDAASVSSSPAAVGGSSLFGEKSTSASANFSSTASPSGKRKMTCIEDDASSRSEPGNVSGKRRKSTGESTAGASPLQKSSTNSEKKKGNNGHTSSGSGVSAASDTVTMFATSFVSQSQRGNSPVRFTAPFSSLSSTQDSAEGTAASSGSLQGSESENDTESNASAGEDDGEGEEEEGESESSATPPPTTNGGRSLFDRVELDQSGKPVRQDVLEAEDKVAIPSPGEKDSNSAVSSLFAGSKFASSFNSPASIGTPQFSNGFDFKSPGALSPTNASPEASDANSPPVILASSAGTSTPTAPVASATTSSLFSKATSSLLPNGSAQLSPFPLSAGTSADVSRATTPNLSEAGAEEPEESTEELPQVDLLRGGTGEEDEDEVFEARAKTLKLGVPPDADDETPKWLLQGVGLLRILKNKTTGRSRILVRADPSGRVLLNTNLVAAINYKSVGSAVRFLVPREPKPENWIAMVKKEDIAVELAKVMEKYKT
ncbi:hypothetical protein BDBG_03620 [Blastomyces gilchristii SLH14081]|uniref:RanBD1 domain-containing protein n=1 Tax=Blastomyces gilchristii (strain SLH14081) TaxID=559298 RepID=A0A179UK35_BLAGS|nr:uncharacterized protein BDBG_03620 [Blastomyces gilchristii SLH14081]OAT07579.1 hypothetical protein BDBG_03620 [Blastomyces gilchristii SLH14081]